VLEKTAVMQQHDTVQCTYDNYGATYLTKWLGESAIAVLSLQTNGSAQIHIKDV